nr:metallophosphoesterase family protein [Candidatus Sigynarchaeota archaeon]
MPRQILNEKYAKIVALCFMWGCVAQGIIAGILLAIVFKEDVIPYVGYYLLVVGGTIALFAFMTRLLVKRKSIHMAVRVPVIFWLCVVTGAGIVGLYFTVPKFTSQYFTAGPRLTWATGQDPSSAITASWVTTFPGDSVVRYGMSRGNLNGTFSVSGSTRFHHVALTGLAANTTYYYQVFGFPVKQFTTAPSGAFNYTFTAWADHRTNTDITISFVQPNIVEGMSALMATDGIDPAFSFFCGDLTSQAYDFLGWETWFKDTSFADWSVNRSLQIAFGNHERAGDPDKTVVKQFYPYTQQGDGHFYYSFNYGLAHFIVLDPYLVNHDWASNFTAEQLAWLEADLAAHSGDTYKMVFMHPPPRNLPEIKLDMARLSVQYGIDLVIAGHQHEYRLVTANGTKYMTIGLGGNPNSHFTGTPCDTAFVRVDVSPVNLHVLARFTNGTVLGNFTIPA